MKLGIIGGSGIYELEHMTDVKSFAVDTPFGKPSDDLIKGKIGDIELIFLPRHGRGHRILPGELNHRANIFALKKTGVTKILSISAVGSLKKKMKPRDAVIVTQYFDRTKQGLEHSFFGNGIVGHVSMAEPVCHELSDIAFRAAKKAVKKLKGEDIPTVHKSGSYLNMEGPAFSTKAESQIYRKWGLDIIGMTNIGEARLAREAEICYSSIAMVTDYDCWHPDHDHVSVDMIMKNFSANIVFAKMIISEIIPMLLKADFKCACSKALASAIITAPGMVDQTLRKKLEPIIGKYLPA